MPLCHSRMAPRGFAALLMILAMSACGQDLLPEDDFAYATKAQLAAGPDAGVDAAVDSSTTLPDAGPGDAGPECETAFDCLHLKGKTPCKQPNCDGGKCTLKQLAVDTPCTDTLLSLKECQQTLCDTAGTCVVAALPDAEPCGFGLCGKLCKSGACEVAGPADYDDGNACTKDYCKQGTEVVHEALTDLSLGCDDGNACTEAEYCAAGVCVGTPLSCDDGFACTADACNPTTGCINTGDASKCDDSDPCTKDACDIAVGCTVVGDNVGSACDDGNDCTEADACGDGGACGGTQTCKCAADADCAQKSNGCLVLVCVAGLCSEDLGKTVVCDPSANTSCAKSTCDPADGSCAMLPIAEGVVCDDGNACTTTSTCVEGACVGAGVAVCDDKNPCTQDSCSAADGCVFVTSVSPCDDGDKCTTEDVCTDGACIGAAAGCDDSVPCTKDGCDGATGECTHTAADLQCDDENPCTKDACDAKKGCLHSDDAAAKCDDGDACTTDACQGGQCVVADYLCQCKGDADCDDNNPCTKDACGGGKCTNAAAADGATCSTSDKCQVAGSGVCKAGLCGGGKPVDCDKDVGACQVGICDPATGKCETVAKTDGAKCDADASGCTVKDACVAGACVAGAAADCSAKDAPCSVGVCKSQGENAFECAVEHLAKDSECEDGVFCTVLDKCDGQGTCLTGFIRTCSEAGDACNKGKCDEAAGACATTPLSKLAKCDDGAWCTVDDTCDGAGVCVGGTAKECSGGACTVGICDEAKDACTTQPAAKGAACSDGDGCTLADSCDGGGKCLGANPKVCEGELCQTGSCKSGSCVKTPVAENTVCEDGDPCTTETRCKSGKCAVVNAKECSGDACNLGVCDVASGDCGLKAKGDGATCDDGSACTDKDACLGGKCQAGSNTCECAKDADCDDSNVCTNDTCADVAGKKVCKNAINTGAGCDDGKKCTKSDVCGANGACSGAAVSCDDKKVCTTDYCDTKTGSCVFKSKIISLCDDGKKCTTNDKCDGNDVCKGTPKTCNDNNVCTSDACTESKGACAYTKKSSGSCSDGNVCTESDTCSSGTCTGKPKDCDDKNACTADVCDKSKGCQYSAVNEGKFCADTRICASSKCVCKYLSVYTGISPPVTENLFGVTANGTGGVIAVGKRYKSGSGDEGLCEVVDAGNNIAHSVTIAGEAKSDSLRDIIPFGSGFYLAAGERHDTGAGKNRGWLVKMDEQCGVKSSLEFYESNFKSYGHFFSGVVTDGGTGAWAVGQRSDPLPSTQFGWVVHVDSSLNQVKSVLVGEPLTKTQLQAVVRDSMGNYLTVGHTNAKSAGGDDGTAAMFNKDGKVLWWKRYGTSAADRFRDVALDGNAAWAVGETSINKASNGTDYWVVKLDLAGGTQLFSKVTSGAGDEGFWGITVSGSSRIAVGRTHAGNFSSGGGYIARLSSTGAIEKGLIGGSSSGANIWQTLTIIGDGRVFAVGQAYSTSTSSLNPWVRSFGSSLEFTCK